jgi:hypothetical protein
MEFELEALELFSQEMGLTGDCPGGECIFGTAGWCLEGSLVNVRACL